MNTLSLVLEILNSLGLGGVAIFLFFFIRGLKERINNLIDLTREQNKTLEVVKERALEYEKWKDGYKQMLIDYEEMGEIIENLRKKTVEELHQANQKKDDELAELKKNQLREIEKRKAVYEKFKTLEEESKELRKELEEQRKLVIFPNSGSNTIWGSEDVFGINPPSKLPLSFGKISILDTVSSLLEVEMNRNHRASNWVVGYPATDAQFTENIILENSDSNAPDDSTPGPKKDKE